MIALVKNDLEDALTIEFLYYSKPSLTSHYCVQTIEGYFEF